MSQTVKVHFFGEFRLESGTASLNEERIHSKKVMKLMAYLLLNHDRMISAEELGELIWGNGGSSNPMGALKNLVYRVRSVLKQLGSEEYIVSGTGTYGWNHDIELRSDMSEFKYYAEQTRERSKDINEQIRKYEQAVACYEKPQTSVLTSDSWMSVRYTYHHSVYMKLVNELCELYSSVHAYDKIQNVCGYAMSCDELNEDTHYWLIKSWVGQGNIENALKQYDTAMKILYERLGMHRSQRMRELYDEILGMSKDIAQATMDDIYGEIQEEDPNGVFFCEYTVFREIYRLEARRVLRSGIAEFMILLTVVIDEKRMQTEPTRIQYYRKKAIDKLQLTLWRHLRMGDVAARYSEEQYVVMLSYCSYEAAQKVIQRITVNFNKIMGNNRIQIKAETREVSIHNELPLERKGGTEWIHEKKK